MDVDQFGVWLCGQRAAVHLTQEELAERAGVSVRTVQTIESGRASAPRPATRRRIIEALRTGGGADADTVSSASTARAVTPAQLPADVEPFTGREEELAALDKVLEAGTARAVPVVVISALSGAAGVGKTALAVHWAYRVRARFPDGHLYVNLRGYDLDRPVPPEVALSGFLRSLGVESPSLPQERDELAVLYRTLLAHRRILVLLDNAAGAEQVRPLLPGGGSSMALVTSRDSLRSLVARDGARRVHVGPMPPGTAVDLLAKIIGDRVYADPAAAAALAERCGHLPLALRIAAERAVGAHDLPIGTLVAELAGERRLDTFDTGDVRTDLRSVYSWSYRSLPAPAAAAFRGLGLYPGEHADGYVVAALLDVDVATADGALRTLARAHLVEERSPGRYGMHDLIRDYARERASTEPEAAREAATARLFDSVNAAVAVAMDVFLPHDRRHRPVPPAGSRPVPAFPDPAAARSWLDERRSDLVRIAGRAAASGHPGAATALSALLWRYLDGGAHHAEAIRLHEYAVEAARQAGDPRGEATSLRLLGVVQSRLGRLDKAEDLLRAALDGFTHTGDRTGAASASLSLGAVALQSGRYPEALDRFAHALRIFEDVEDQSGVAETCGNIGGVHFVRGDYAGAARYTERALAAFRRLDDVTGIGRSLGNLGELYERLGRYDDSLIAQVEALEVLRGTDNRLFTGRCLANLAAAHRHVGRVQDAVERGDEALALTREIGDREGEAKVLDDLGAAELARGRPRQAIDLRTRALAIAREIGDLTRESGVRNGLAEAHAATADLDTALEHGEAALALATRIGNVFEQARALEITAGLLCRRGATGEAESRWRSSLTLYGSLGLPDADRVNAMLAASEF